MIDLDTDVRLLRRNLAKGFISHEAIAKLQAALPDVSDRAEYFDPEALDAPAGDADQTATAAE